MGKRVYTHHELREMFYSGYAWKKDGQTHLLGLRRFGDNPWKDDDECEAGESFEAEPQTDEIKKMLQLVSNGEAGLEEGTVRLHTDFGIEDWLEAQDQSEKIGLWDYADEEIFAYSTHMLAEEYAFLICQVGSYFIVRNFDRDWRGHHHYIVNCGSPAGVRSKLTQCADLFKQLYGELGWEWVPLPQPTETTA